MEQVHDHGQHEQGDGDADVRELHRPGLLQAIGELFLSAELREFRRRQHSGRQDQEPAELRRESGPQ